MKEKANSGVTQLFTGANKSSACHIMEPTNITKLRKVFCPTHKAAFDAPSQPRVVCEIVEHILTDNLARAEYWEYCCNCQTYWPSRLGQGGPAAESCPSCQRVGVRRYVCQECRLVSVESDEAAKGKTHNIGERGISPGCPFCESKTLASVQAHHCGEAKTELVSSRERCPFCEVSLAKPKVTTPAPLLGLPCQLCQTRSEIDASFCVSCGIPLKISTTSATETLPAAAFVPPEVFTPKFEPTPEIAFENTTAAATSSQPFGGNGKILAVLGAVVSGLILIVVLVSSSKRTNTHSTSSGNVVQPQPPSLNIDTPAAPSSSATLPSSFNREYKGTIGGKTFSMSLVRNESELKGSASTNRNSDTLSGTIDSDGEFNLDGYEDGQNYTGIYSGRIYNDGTISGKWAKPNGTRAVAFTVTQQ